MTTDHPSDAPKSLTLADFTSEGLIIPQLQARDPEGVILELSQVFQRVDPRWDAQKLGQLALEREGQMSTAMEFGAAFPHVRSPICPFLRFALGRSEKAFRWGGAESVPVNFVFLHATPEDDPMGYLRLVSGMARLGKDPALFEQFLRATTAPDLLAVLAKVPVRH